MTLKELGFLGENRAADYLDSKGYVILKRNYRCKYGEVDIIAREGNTLCFVEVKTRKNTRHGLPCEAVSRDKVMHIKRCAHIFMSRFRGDYEAVRVEVVELIYNEGKFFVRHLKNVEGR